MPPRHRIRAASTRYFAYYTVALAIVFWTPILVRDAIHTSDSQHQRGIALLSALAYPLAGMLSDRSSERWRVTALGLVLGGAGCGFETEARDRSVADRRPQAVGGLLDVDARPRSVALHSDARSLLSANVAAAQSPDLSPRGKLDADVNIGNAAPIVCACSDPLRVR
jgi:hypothetical protein